MPRVRLTDAVAAKAKLPADKAETTLWDTELVGFGLRLRDGAKTWIVSYRLSGAGRSGTKKRLKLGTPATIPNATEARRLARAALGKVAAGQDPAAERAAAKQKPTTRVTDLLDAYDRDLERRGYVNREMVVKGLRRQMEPLLERDIVTVTGAEVASIVQKMDAAGKRGAAEQFRSKARTFFGFCQAEAKVITINPLAGFRKQRATRADRLAKGQHGRALSDAELVQIWRTADIDTLFGRVIRYLILTGCRRNEAAILLWPMVDRGAGLVRLPAAVTKQGRPHDLPIAPLLGDVFDACPVIADSDYVFASVKTGGIISGWRTMRDKIEVASKVDFLLHDLRRTFRTGLSRLGVEDTIAELAIGHVRKDLEARYNRDQAEDAIRAAFEKWDRHVAGLLAKVDEPAPAENLGVFA